MSRTEPRPKTLTAWWSADPVRRAVILTAIASAVAVALILGRSIYTGRWSYRFLYWNLFLAWVPLFFALGARWAGHRGGRRWLAVLLGLCWLAFFPNAPYILTDLMHLRTTRGGPIWLDVLMVGATAWAGILVGLLSLRLMHDLVDSWSRRIWVGWVFAGAAAFLAAFGVYLGRFQRWNSWDILVHPGDVLYDALTTLTAPRAFVFTAALGGFLLVAYITVAALARLPVPPGRGEPGEAHRHPEEEG